MKKYLILILLAAFFASCEDQLDRTPDDVLVEQTAFQNVNDLKSGLNGVMSGFTQFDLIQFNSIFGDNNKIGVDSGGQGLNLFNQILDPQNSSGGIWGNRYNNANRVNRVLAAAELITPELGEEDEYNLIVGQLRALRAYFHYELLNYYGENAANPTALGVFYQNTVETNATPERPTTQVTVDAILADLADAESLIPADYTNNTFPTRDFITFTRARLALLTENWSEVINQTNPLIAKYPLADQEQYVAMFSSGDDTEVIFKRDALQGSNPNYAGAWIFTGTLGNFFEVSDQLFNLLEQEANSNGDIRRFVAVGPEGVEDGEYQVWKFPGSAGQFINPHKSMRISEAYLMRAEAHARGAANFQAAANDIQAVKNARRGTSSNVSAYTNLQAAIADLARERRLELCFEGHRYIDVKRYRNILNQGFERDPVDCPGNVPCNLPVTDARWVFPIPQVELNGNPNVQQNPQWE